MNAAEKRNDSARVYEKASLFKPDDAGIHRRSIPGSETLKRENQTLRRVQRAATNPETGVGYI